MLHTMIALIPAYEPGSALAPLCAQLEDAGFSVVVVDDGSGPAWHDLFASLDPRTVLLTCPENHGKGSALKTGFQYLADRAAPECVVVTLDCDGQHTPEDALRVAAAAALRPDALTLGVRSFGPGTPLRSRFGNAVTRCVYHLASGQRVSDTQTGLRACGVGLLPLLEQVAGERYEYEMNVLMECPLRGIPIREVPIRTIYLDRNRGSHFSTLRDSARIYGNLLKFAGSSLLGFAVDYSLYSLLAVSLAGLGAASIPISNVSARIVSAGTNFAVNKRFVFRSRDSLLRTGAQYFALAACILAGNTVLLSLLVNVLGWNKFAAKLITELTFFTFSFLAQRFWIFRRGQTPASSPAAPGARKEIA